MSKAWPRVRLGDVLRYHKNFVTIDDLTTYRRPRVQLHARGIVLRDEVQGALIKTKQQQMCRFGDLLVAEIDAKHGGFGLVPRDLEGAIVSSHYFLFDIDESKLGRRFLDWFIRTPSFRDQVEAQGSTNYASIRPNDVLGYEIPLPPVPEQHRLVARIEELAAQVHEAQSLRKQAAEEAFEVPAAFGRKLFRQTEARFPSQALGEVVTVRGGGTPSKTNPFYWSGTIPWVTPKDMKVRQIHDATDHISESAVRESPAKIIAPGAVLVVVRGMILAHTFPSAVLRVPAAINQDMKALIPGTNLLPEFLCSFFWADNQRFLAAVEKSTHDTRKLETSALLNKQIPLPPVSEQRRMVAAFECVQTEVEALKRVQAQTSAEIDALLPSILDRAFKGEL